MMSEVHVAVQEPSGGRIVVQRVPEGLQEARERRPLRRKVGLGQKVGQVEA